MGLERNWTIKCAIIRGVSQVSSRSPEAMWKWANRIQVQSGEYFLCEQHQRNYCSGMLSCLIFPFKFATSSAFRTFQIQILRVTCISTQRRLLARFLKYGKPSVGRNSSRLNWPPCIHVGYDNSLLRRLHSNLLENMSSLMTGWFKTVNWHQGAPPYLWLLYVIFSPDSEG